MKSKNIVSSLPSKWFSLLTSESTFQRSVAPVVKVVLIVWSKDSSDKNEYKPIKPLVFSNVKDAIESKDISSDLIDYTSYEIYINDNLVEFGRYKDLKNSVTKDYIDFAKELGNGVPPVTN